MMVSLFKWNSPCLSGPRSLHSMFIVILMIKVALNLSSEINQSSILAGCLLFGWFIGRRWWLLGGFLGGIWDFTWSRWQRNWRYWGGREWPVSPRFMKCKKMLLLFNFRTENERKLSFRLVKLKFSAYFFHMGSSSFQGLASRKKCRSSLFSRHFASFRGLKWMRRAWAKICKIRLIRGC